LNYDPVLAKETMAKCVELQGQGKFPECKAILSKRVFAGIASPEEGETLVAICMTMKDRTCGLNLEDAGVIKPGVYDLAQKRSTLPVPGTGSCAACGTPPKKK
jgi:hypothetical protein